MLVADSHTTRDDIIIFSNEPVHVLGTVVLALSPSPAELAYPPAAHSASSIGTTLRYYR